ncbi:MAG: TonB-dependent receptor [Saprospiraceae bacterium]|nr:TonB-dependent receptor [Saprospiraceae bacterium]
MQKFIYSSKTRQRAFFGKMVPLALSFFALLFALTPTALAASGTLDGLAPITVTGVVRDAKGETLIGASIYVKGDVGTGTVTDVDGSYEITVDENATLVFSYTGYESQEIAVAGRKVIDVILAESSLQLDQVVVVGYGTLTKKQVTGAISQVKGDDLKKQPLLTAAQGIQGLATGIQVIGSGEPGTQPRVQIRGINTVLTNENPLYVVDGVITDNITNINTADIFSIDVLKDGAAAIYGTRAANGVILITTKRGREGKMSVSLDTYRGFRQLINVVDMADAQFYANYTNEARAYDGQVPLFDPDTLAYNTNWFDEISQRGVVQNYSLNISGGTPNLSYLFSGGYFSDEGVLVGAQFERVTLRNNNEYRPFKFLKIGNVLNVNLNKSRNKPTGAFTDAYRMGASAPVISPYQNYGFINGLSVANPVATLELAHNYDRSNRLQGSFYGEADILPGLTARSSWGFDKGVGDNTNYSGVYQYSIYNNPISELRLNNYRSLYWIWDQTLRYSTKFGNNNTVELLGGHSSERDNGTSMTIRVADVPADRNLWYVGQGDPSKVTVPGHSGYLLTRESWFGRANIGFLGKYNLSGTIRRDGSSAFPKDQQWGTFYSVGASWIVSEESFFKDADFVDYLKARAGYAVLGNDNISRIVNNELAALLSVSQTDPYGFPNGLVGGITINQLKDAAATWEETKSIDAGLEFGFAKYFSGEVSYYNKLTNAYIRVPTPSVVDPDGILSRAADVRNKGLEIALKWNKVSSADFGYRLGVNATFNKNNVEKVVGGIDLKDGGLGNGEVTTSTVVGQPIGSFWVYETDGIFQSQDEIDAAPHFTGTLPGDFRYKDTNGDGALDERDRIFAGSYQPKMFYGIEGGVNYKNFDFTVNCYGNAGNKVYNGKKGVRFGNDSIEASREDRWTESNRDTNEPRASNSIPKPSTYFVESGSFFRINNITLGYTLPTSVTEKASIGKARFFVSAQNPIVKKKFSGFTSELPGSSALNSGIELGIYPTLATYMVGINVDFN